MKRLFIAMEISTEARQFASELIRRLRTDNPVKGVSWSKPENLHITLKFLGDTDDASEAKVIRALSEIASKFTPFSLHLDKPELLGNRVISIAVRSDSQTVFSIEKAVDTESGKLGYVPDGRRYHPHLTLARMRRSKGIRELSQEFLQTRIKPLGFEVRELVLYESVLGPGGSVYKVVQRFGLSA